jgi:hypothetical protein
MDGWMDGAGGLEEQERGTDEGMRRKGSTRSRGRKPGSEKDLNVKGAKNKIREVLGLVRTHTSHRPFSGCSQHIPHSDGAIISQFLHESSTPFFLASPFFLFN